jgi:pseudouridine-5'-phosphate glycosidase
MEIAFHEIESKIQQALNEAKLAGISGKETTPFLLKRIAEITGGNSLATNIALIKNNALLGAKVAIYLAKIS